VKLAAKRFWTYNGVRWAGSMTSTPTASRLRSGAGFAISSTRIEHVVLVRMAPAALLLRSLLIVVVLRNVLRDPLTSTNARAVAAMGTMGTGTRLPRGAMPSSAKETEARLGRRLLLREL